MNKYDGEQLNVIERRVLRLEMIHTNTDIYLADSYSIGDRVYGSETG